MTTPEGQRLHLRLTAGEVRNVASKVPGKLNAVGASFSRLLGYLTAGDGDPRKEAGDSNIVRLATTAINLTVQRWTDALRPAHDAAKPFHAEEAVSGAAFTHLPHVEVDARAKAVLDAIARVGEALDQLASAAEDEVEGHVANVTELICGETDSVFSAMNHLSGLATDHSRSAAAARAFADVTPSNNPGLA